MAASEIEVDAAKGRYNQGGASKWERTTNARGG